MVTNFTREEIVLPKATVLGVAEEISEALVATINTEETPQVRTNKCPNRHSTKEEMDQTFKQYMKEGLAHLTHDERTVREPVLIRYRRVFHDEENIDFKGTDLVEHRIVTGDAKPIRRPPYRTPFALRQEMENQVQDMLDKGVIEPSASPWNSPVILVPKKSKDGRPKYRFCIDFRALNAITRFDACTLPVFEDTMSTLHGSKYVTTF
jgi:hypothetical protein